LLPFIIRTEGLPMICLKNERPSIAILIFGTSVRYMNKQGRRNRCPASLLIMSSRLSLYEVDDMQIALFLKVDEAVAFS